MEITIDNKIDDVLKLDKEGEAFSFSSEVGKFLEIDKKYLNLLSEKTLQAYRLAKHDHLEECKVKLNDLAPSNVSIGTKFMLASDKLKVVGMPSHLHAVWKRPDELPYFEDIGYKVWEKGDPGKPFNNGRIGKAGDFELVLMWTTKENHMLWVKDVENKSKAMSGLPVKNSQDGEVMEQDLKMG